MRRHLVSVRLWVVLVALVAWTAVQLPIGPRASISASIIVYGATPSGVIAAVTAARGGATTILLEPTSHVGGMMANGLVATDIHDKRTVGGFAKEFFDRIADNYAARGLAARWQFEPHIAEQVFEEMLADAGVALVKNARLLQAGSVAREGNRISFIITSAGSYGASVFIDASYGGDLMAAAGIPYALGRESTDAYGESLAGVQRTAQVMISANLLPADFTAVPPPGPLGSADARIQGSNFRLCFSSAGSRVPFSRPEGYDRARYLHAAQRLKFGALEKVLTITPTVPEIYDVNSSGYLSIDPTGWNWDWPEATYEERQRIEEFHADYAKGYVWFLATDRSVPSDVRTILSRYGWCPLEWADNGHFPRDLYIREARRLLGDKVLTQHDIDPAAIQPDAIGVASYRVDAHAVTRWAEGADIYVEGSLTKPAVNYAIPYSIMLPRRADATNLLVSVAASASHVAWASLRMEPHFMAMGEAAGQAALTSVLARRGVHDISVAVVQEALMLRGVPLPGAPCLLELTALSDVVPGVSFPMTVTYTDVLDRTCAGTITFTASDGTAALPPNVTFTTDGPRSMNVVATLNTTGPHRVRARDVVLTDNTVVSNIRVKSP